MKRFVISCIEPWFVRQIDQALDDAKPLNGLTAWAVRHSDMLREYYENMLELEIELRFSNTDRKEQSPLEPMKNQNRFEWKKLPVSRIIMVSILVFVGMAFALGMFVLKNRLGVSKQKPDMLFVDRLDHVKNGENLIDVGKFFSSTFGNIIPIPASLFENVSTDSSSKTGDLTVDPIIRFSESPLQSSFYVLRSLRIVDIEIQNDYESLENRL